MSDIMEEIKKIQLENAIAMKKMREDREKENKDREKENKERRKEIDADFKKIRIELGWIWNSQEEVWIDLFRRNMKWILRKRGINIDRTTTRFKNDVRLDSWEILKWEYDLMWINGKDIVVVEVKNKLRSDDIEKFLEKQLPKFKILFPQYKDYNLYWWIWSLIVWEHQEKIAEKKGLFVFTQWEDWNAMIMNKKDFKAKIF